jgi:hypothetical protein
MRTVAARRTIEAPIEKVWVLATDIGRWPEATSGVERVELLTDGDFGESTRWRETRQMFGREATEEMSVSAVDPGRCYTVEAENHGVRYVSTFSFTATGPEQAEGVVIFDVQPWSGSSGSWARSPALWLRGASRRRSRATWPTWPRPRRRSAEVARRAPCPMISDRR